VVERGSGFLPGPARPGVLWGLAVELVVLPEPVGVSGDEVVFPGEPVVLERVTENVPAGVVVERSESPPQPRNVSPAATTSNHGGRCGKGAGVSERPMVAVLEWANDLAQLVARASPALSSPQPVFTSRPSG